MKRLFPFLAAIVLLATLLTAAGCSTSASQANAQHEREKLEKPQVTPRL